jgi:LysR family hydrogen peroxide-inducible transcriptional activator
VLRDDFYVAFPPGHRLEARDRIDEAALQSERMLLLEDGHCLRDQALAACGRMRQHEADGFAATTLHTLVQMVASGLGVTILPRLAVTAGVTQGTNLVLRPLVGEHAWRTIGLAWRPESGRAADYRALAPMLAKACR